MGIRDNETRMRALGYPVFRLQLVAFAIAGAIAGLAGALLAGGNGFVSPATMHWTQSATLVVMVVIGGLGRSWAGRWAPWSGWCSRKRSSSTPSTGTCHWACC